MPSDQPSLSENEIYLRVNAPVFFDDLMSAHTASLIERGDPEALTAWKEIRQQSGQEFAAVPAEEIARVGEEREKKSFDMQSIEFAAALTRFAAESDIPLSQYDLSPQKAVAVYGKILEEELELRLSDAAQDLPPVDRQMEANREIDQSKTRHQALTDPRTNSFGLSQAARDELIEDQRKVGKLAREAQQQSLDPSQDHDIDPPDHDD